MIENIPGEVYKALSFSNGEQPNFDLLKKHCADNCLFINNKGESPVALPVDEYVNRMQGFIDQGAILAVEEVEIINKVDVYGKIARIYSEYRLDFEGPKGKQVRFGINLFQLALYENHWKIISTCWDDRTDKSLLSSANE